MRTGLELLVLIRRMYASQFTFRDPGGHYHFDRLAGTDTVRQMIQDGASAESIMDTWKDAQKQFLSRRGEWLLYDAH